MGNNAVKQHFETAQRTGVLKISNKRLKVNGDKKFRFFDNQLNKRRPSK